MSIAVAELFANAPQSSFPELEPWHYIKNRYSFLK
jgi:hypothetical protein